MDDAERFINQQRAEQDQADAARKQWEEKIGELKDAAEKVVEGFRNAGVTDFSVRKTDDTIAVKFGSRPIGLGGRFTGEIQNGATAVFYFENGTYSVVGERTPFHTGACHPEKFVDFGQDVEVDEFRKAVLGFMEWATTGDGCGGHKFRF